MIIYPTGESKTNLQTSPLATALVIFVVALAHAFMVYPLQSVYNSHAKEKLDEVHRLIDRDLDTARLDQTYAQLAHNDPAKIGDPNYRNIYSPELREAYRRYATVTPPLVSFLDGPSYRRMLLVVLPSHAWLVLIFFACMLACGYMFEHWFKPWAMGVYFLLAAVYFTLVPMWIPTAPMLSPALAWSAAGTAFFIFCLLQFYAAKITFELSIFGRKKIPFTVPLWLFAVAFIAAAAYFIYGQPYPHTKPEPMQASTIVLFAGIFFLVSRFLPKQEDVELLSSDAAINQVLAEIERNLDDQNYQKADQLLERALEMSPSTDQLFRLGETAWMHNQNTIAEQCFKTALRNLSQNKDFNALVKAIEDISVRGITPPLKSLLMVTDQAIAKDRLDALVKLMATIKAHPEMDVERARQIFDRMIEAAMQKRPIPRDTLLEIRSWLSQDTLYQDQVATIETFLAEHADSGTEMSAQTHIEVNTAVDVFEITTNHLEIKVPGKGIQKVPWGAVQALHGAQLVKADRQEKIGAVVLKYNRKLFCCYFKSENIRKKDRLGKVYSFDAFWDAIHLEIPEDIPFTDLHDFSVVQNIDSFLAAVDAYLKQTR